MGWLLLGFDGSAIVVIDFVDVANAHSLATLVVKSIIEELSLDGAVIVLEQKISHSGDHINLIVNYIH